MRIQPPSPPTPRAKHRRLNNRTGVCVCVCVFFKVVRFPFFFFFCFWPRAAVFPLRSQFIYVHYFRLPDFYSPSGVFLGTRARAEHNAREGLAQTRSFRPSRPLYRIASITLPLYIIIRYNTKVYLISPPSILNRFHSKSSSCRRIMFAENPSLRSFRCTRGKIDTGACALATATD